MDQASRKKKSIRVSASSYWRESQDMVKDECDRYLDMKVDDTVRREERNDFFLTRRRNQPYSIQFDQGRELYRCTREAVLLFEAYEEEKFKNAIPSERWADLSGDRRRALLAPLMSVDMFAPGPLDAFVEQAKAQIPESYSLRLAAVVIELPRISVALDNVRFIRSNLTLTKDPDIVGLPLEESDTIIPVNNCASTELRISRGVKYELVEGYRISLTETLSTELGITGELTFDGGTLGGSFRQTASFEKAQEYTKTTSQNREEMVDIVVAPFKKVRIRLTAQQFASFREFSGGATIDADVAAVYGGGFTKHYALSDLLNEVTRTIDISGKYYSYNTRVLPIDIQEESC